MKWCEPACVLGLRAFWWLSQFPPKPFFIGKISQSPLSKKCGTQKKWNRRREKPINTGFVAVPLFFEKWNKFHFFWNKKWNKEGFGTFLGEIFNFGGAVELPPNAPFASLTTLLHGKCQRMSEHKKTPPSFGSCFSYRGSYDVFQKLQSCCKVVS